MSLPWDEDAEARLKKAPFFVRPFIRVRVEKIARDRGLPKVTLALLDEVKSSEHQGS